MTLNEFIQIFPRWQRTSIRKWVANKLNISEVYVRSMCNGNKPVLAKYARRIEKITGGAVPKHITAPDMFLEKE